MNLRTHKLLIVGLALVAPSCSDAAADTNEVLVVATTSILGDVTANIVGDSDLVEVLISIGVDPHDFQPSARQVARMAEADLVVVNGLGLEEELVDVLASIGRDGQAVLSVGDLLGSSEPVDGGASDPHFWMDPRQVVKVIDLIADALEELSVEGPWRVNADHYRAEVEAVDFEIQAILEAIPEHRRFLVTNHESLRYFAGRYKFEVIGVVVPGGSTPTEPSSSHLADLVRVMEQVGVPAVFADSTEPASLVEAVASEVGDGVEVVELFIGSLGGPGSGAETYIEMIRTDAVLIAGALG